MNDKRPMNLCDGNFFLLFSPDNPIVYVFSWFTLKMLNLVAFKDDILLVKKKLSSFYIRQSCLDWPNVIIKTAFLIIPRKTSQK